MVNSFAELSNAAITLDNLMISGLVPTTVTTFKGFIVSMW